jgi:hypothetical protein
MITEFNVDIPILRVIKKYPYMKFQGIGFLLFSGILMFAASTVWNTVAAYGYLKITSPAKGQKVPLGNIVISGTSSSNATTIAQFQLI